MNCEMKNSERLYLSRGDQEIYIDNCDISQHHIDGIRFIYRLFKKKKPGCIINYRPGDSRNLQVVLFLKAVLNMFTRPVLVLCNQEHEWMEYFRMWTDLYDEVKVTEKPLFKKSIQINTMCNLTEFTRNEWSVLIVDSDKLAHQVLKLPFKTDFKIFITSHNINRDLDKFSQIYAWLHPEEAKQKNIWKFDKNEFIPDKRNCVDVLNKAIRLDAFMEDIVSNSYVSDVGIEQHHSDFHSADNIPRITVSRKNKDATGTKIKRSKRKIYDDDITPSSKISSYDTNVPDNNERTKYIPLNNDSPPSVSDVSDTKLKRSKRKIYDDDDITPSSKISTYDTKIPDSKIYNNELTKDIPHERGSPSIYDATDTKMKHSKRKIYDDDDDIIPSSKISTRDTNAPNDKDNDTNPHKENSQEANKEIDEVNSQSINLHFESDTVTDNNSDRDYDMDTLVFSNDILDEDKGLNLNKPVNASNSLEKYINSMDNNSDTVKNVANEMDVEAESDSETVYLSEKSPSTPNDDIKCTAHNKSDNSLDNFTKCSDEFKFVKGDTIKYPSDINEVCTKNEMHIDKSINRGEGTLDITNSINDNFNEVQESINQDSSLVVNKSVDDQTAASDTNISKRDSIDEKIKLMEDNAMKKFKGSILDSLF